ncbi:MAG: hypothetical protein ABII22_04210 [Candidatus Micrarchaeota archaeon]
MGDCITQIQDCCEVLGILGGNGKGMEGTYLRLRNETLSQDTQLEMAEVLIREMNAYAIVGALEEIKGILGLSPEAEEKIVILAIERIRKEGIESQLKKIARSAKSEKVRRAVQYALLETYKREYNAAHDPMRASPIYEKIARFANASDTLPRVKKATYRFLLETANKESEIHQLILTEGVPEDIRQEARERFIRQCERMYDGYRHLLPENLGIPQESIEYAIINHVEQNDNGRAANKKPDRCLKISTERRVAPELRNYYGTLGVILNLENIKSGELNHHSKFLAEARILNELLGFNHQQEVVEYGTLAVIKAMIETRERGLLWRCYRSQTLKELNRIAENERAPESIRQAAREVSCFRTRVKIFFGATERIAANLDQEMKAKYAEFTATGKIRAPKKLATKQKTVI